MKFLLRFINKGTVVNLIDPSAPLLYLGPETLMPLASILAAIVGFFLMFWRLIAKFFKKIYRKIRGLPTDVPPDVDLEDTFDEEQEF
jgi:hypothetical protein